MSELGTILHPYLLWIRAAHVISVIFWMAGMFMMPRYFAYHAEAAPGSDEDRRWVERERRLLRLIVNPAMLAAWLFGLMLVAIIGFDGAWLPAKLAIVLGLSALHGFYARWRKAFAAGANRHSTRFYRLVNEIPTLAVIAIVILVIVKPF